MPTGSPVRRATLGDAPRLAQALASAFQDDPVITWIFPDQRRRRRVLPAFMEFRLRKLAFPHDEVWMTAGGAAAAISASNPEVKVGNVRTSWTRPPRPSGTRTQVTTSSLGDIHPAQRG
jgi:hypothetical protein